MKHYLISFWDDEQPSNIWARNDSELYQKIHTLCRDFDLPEPQAIEEAAE